ncbi:hypothetical protein PNEG_00411 [Pneumocystis murina B123]|uniref:Uncharacterized protein n=1 Tax=Pneumocystis murina (strain B123) TaxID=1069680 RepID=M7NVR3_PNEMU|nr:hypothetical protein PNEG_00411 [Pneumocystis murina B123]EMR11387.1 hypothetical protein PNEG_00411 [Pneumocystis murina B123]
MAFESSAFNKRKRDDKLIDGLIENRKKRLLETFSELTLNEGIHKQDFSKDVDMKNECYYEKDAHTTVIENIEDFVDKEEKGGEIKSNISFLKGICEKIVNIQNFISQPQERVTDLILYQCPQCCIYGYSFGEKKCLHSNNDVKYEDKMKYQEMSDEEDTSMNMDIF